MTQPTRPYDSLYDATFTVAGPRDHYRQQTLGGGFNIERAPVYNNFFSELPHYPPSTLRLKNADRVPAFIDRNYHPQPQDAADLRQRSDALAVSGAERPKYFRRPLLAAAEIHVKQAPLPPLPQYQDLNATAPASLSEPRSKTVGTQSDYRENEAQTAPWEPGFVLPEHPSVKQQALSWRHHTDGPEVLHLRDMDFADGLPAGLQEVTRIDKMRAKRAFEATLPPIDDAARLPLRQKMIEEWEAREWAEREEEILAIQEQRLGLLENALQVREEEIDEEHQARVEERKKATLAGRAGRFADVQATRIKTMRQLIENRKYVEKHRKLHKPTIVERYANFGSGTYAPLQREGRFPESKPLGQEIETEGYEPVTLKGVLDLESFLPSRLLNPKISAPKRPNRLDFAGRKEAAVQRDLKSINELLDVSKATAGRGYGDCWPAPLKDEGPGGVPGGGLGMGGTGTGGSLKRASSSMGGNRPGLGSASGAAAGAGGGGGGTVAAGGSLLGPNGSSTLGPVISAGGTVSPPRRVARAVERPPTPELPPPPALLAPQHAALVLLQRLLRGRAAQNIMYEGRLRRQELIDELRLAERVSPDGARLDGRPIRRPDDRDAATLRVDALLGSVAAEVCAVLAETNPDKRDVLLAALGSSAAHNAAAAVAAAAAGLSAAVAAAEAAVSAAVAAANAAPAPTESASAAAEPPLSSDAPLSPSARAGTAGSSSSAGAVNLEALGITREEAEEAALRIQAAFQGHRARKEVAAMRARGEMLRRIMAEDNEAKVVVCQAAIRGYLGRKRVQQMRQEREAQKAADAAGDAGAGEDGVKPETSGAAAGGAEEGEEALGKEVEEFDLSSYTEEHVEAVTRIQAAQRGMMARKRVAAMRQQQQQPQEGQQEGEGEEGEEGAQQGVVQDEEGRGAQEAEQEQASAGAGAGAAKSSEVHSDYTVEQEVAVIRIQAAGRGFLARRRVAAMRTEAAVGGGAESEAVQPAMSPRQRTPVIGRQDDGGAAAAAAAAAAAEATSAGEAAATAAKAAEDEDVVWPKMRNLSGFVLTPAAPRAAEEAVGMAPEVEAVGMAPEVEAEASLAGVVESTPSPEAYTEPEMEASLAGGGDFQPAESEPGVEPSLAGAGSVRTEAEGEASLAIGAYGDETGGREEGEREASAALGEPSLAVPGSSAEESRGDVEGEDDDAGNAGGMEGDAGEAGAEGEGQRDGEEEEGAAEGEEPAPEGEGGGAGEEGGSVAQDPVGEESQTAGEGAQEEGGDGDEGEQAGDEAAGGEDEGQEGGEGGGSWEEGGEGEQGPGAEEDLGDDA